MLSAHVKISLLLSLHNKLHLSHQKGLVETKGRWVLVQNFHGNFQVNVTWFFAFFSGVLDWIMLILVWFERTLHSVQVSGQSYPGQSKLMMSQVVERTWICTGSYRWLRGEWVNFSILLFIMAVYMYCLRCKMKFWDYLHWHFIQSKVQGLYRFLDPKFKTFSRLFFQKR